MGDFKSGLSPQLSPRISSPTLAAQASAEESLDAMDSLESPQQMIKKDRSNQDENPLLESQVSQKQILKGNSLENNSTTYTGGCDEDLAFSDAEVFEENTFQDEENPCGAELG